MRLGRNVQNRTAAEKTSGWLHRLHTVLALFRHGPAYAWLMNDE